MATSQYIERTRIKTMSVLSQIFDGDMIETWAAYITIYPKARREVDEDILGEVLKLSAQYDEYNFVK